MNIQLVNLDISYLTSRLRTNNFSFGTIKSSDPSKLPEYIETEAKIAKLEREYKILDEKMDDLIYGGSVVGSLLNDQHAEYQKLIILEQEKF